jgi:hypothetical protein
MIERALGSILQHFDAPRSEWPSDEDDDEFDDDGYPMFRPTISLYVGIAFLEAAIRIRYRHPRRRKLKRLPNSTCPDLGFGSGLLLHP